MEITETLNKGKRYLPIPARDLSAQELVYVYVFRLMTLGENDVLTRCAFDDLIAHLHSIDIETEYEKKIRYLQNEVEDLADKISILEDENYSLQTEIETLKMRLSEYENS